MAAAHSELSFTFWGVGPIYASTDSGATWTPTGAPITNWTSVASSADGTRLVAAAFDALIYTSTNSGATWNPTSAPITYWTSVASSADGSRLAATDPQVLYTSTDAGATWTPALTNFGGPFPGLSSVASSADGSVLVAGAPQDSYVAYSELYTSTNSGTTWEMTTLGPLPVFSLPVASSADGAELGAAFGSAVLRSKDFGAHWTGIAALPLVSSLAPSADGTELVAGTSDSGTYTSTDSGATWSPDLEAITNRTFVASSADGGKLVAVVNDGGIWVSQTIPTPSLNITVSSSNVLVSWTVPSTDFVLQENPDLTTTNWSDVHSPPTLNFTNLNYEVLTSPTNGSRFYRLKH